ncbi:Keratin, type I cytoskeletal 19 [Triplophysa tibetana]|uniref:Keratin, type I cytoskeletal 19 n=1 Tax=Triplophysa tibetana TaxID=1572043 RepID=A0A5A9NF46_9TELE|nr:Keratin, type I cytoskeletal 19 [Triplophysa tibetana]
MSFSVCSSFTETISETCLRTSPDTCVKTFPDTCMKTYPKTCMKTCSITCPDTYVKTCSDPCVKTYPDTCGKTFPDTCVKTCSDPCVKIYPDTCMKTYPETCVKTCSEPCVKIYPDTCMKTYPETCVKTCSEPCVKIYPDTCMKTYPETCVKTCSDPCVEIYPDTCMKTYPQTCVKTCSTTCPDTCVKIYPDTCVKTFPDTCMKTYPETCVKTCSDPCIKTCSITCPKICPDICVKTCPDPYKKTSSITCSKTCPKPCSVSSKSIRIPRHCGAKAHSVYGCGGSTRISTCTYRPITCSPCLPYKMGACHGGFGPRIMKSEKVTMQNLNDRLACYLEKVRFLEASNANLEKIIRDYYEKKRPICQRDYSCFLNTIHCLQEKIRDATIKNASIILQIDNAKLTADDFRIKFDHESAMRQCVEADTSNLRYILEKTCLSKTDLEAQICLLEEERAFMKKKHQEDVEALICQLSQTVCVEVDAAPQQDLKQVLEEIRSHYETIIDKHRKKQECWFREKTAELCEHVAGNTECMETSRSQIADLRRTLQCLEIELLSQINKKGALQCSLGDTEARYGAMLTEFQKHINILEAELCQVHTGIEQQGRDYDALLDIKSRLEKEIATYRCLLENQDLQ